MGDDRPVVVRRLVEPEEQKVEHTTSESVPGVVLISHFPDTYLVVPLGFQVGGDNVQENGVDQETAKSLIIRFLGIRELGESVLSAFNRLWMGALERVQRGERAIFVIEDGDIRLL